MRANHKGSVKEHTLLPSRSSLNALRIRLLPPRLLRLLVEQYPPVSNKIIGEVERPRTVDYKTLTPIKGGLFCETIFGPVRDFRCSCGRTRRYSFTPFCPDCDVRITSSKARRRRLGYIKLAFPVVHVWYLKGRLGYISRLLGISRRKAEGIAYCLRTADFSSPYGDILKHFFKPVAPFLPLPEGDVYLPEKDFLWFLVYTTNPPIKGERPIKWYREHSKRRFFYPPALMQSNKERKPNDRPEGNPNPSKELLPDQEQSVFYKPFLLLKDLQELPNPRLLRKPILLENKGEIKKQNHFLQIRETVDQLKSLKSFTPATTCFVGSRSKRSPLLVLPLPLRSIVLVEKPGFLWNAKTPLPLGKTSRKANSRWVRVTLQPTTRLCFVPRTNPPTSDLFGDVAAPWCIPPRRYKDPFKREGEGVLKDGESCFAQKGQNIKEGKGGFKGGIQMQRPPSQGEGAGERRERSSFSFQERFKRQGKGLIQSKNKNSPTSLQIEQLSTRVRDLPLGAKQDKGDYLALQDRGANSTLTKLSAPVSRKQPALPRLKEGADSKKVTELLWERTSRPVVDPESVLLLVDGKGRESEKKEPFGRESGAKQLPKNTCFFPFGKDNGGDRPQGEKHDQHSGFLKGFVASHETEVKNELFSLYPTPKEDQSDRRGFNSKTPKITFSRGNIKTTQHQHGEDPVHRDEDQRKAEEQERGSTSPSSGLLHKPRDRSTLQTIYRLTYVEEESELETPYDKEGRRRGGSSVEQRSLRRRLRKKESKSVLKVLSLKADQANSIPNFVENTGGLLIRKMLNRFDIEKVYLQLINTEIPQLNNQIEWLEGFDYLSEKEEARYKRLVDRRVKKARRLTLIKNYRQSKVRPEWMTISFLPVIPPTLRPILPVGNGQLAVSDLNKLYQKILCRNARCLESDAKSLISMYAQRLLQEAVDSLLENGKGGSPLALANNGRPLKSLSDVLKGKEGRFRQDLLGKRVDYSARSVIVVGPTLNLHECGLPKQIALELFHPYLVRQLVLKRVATTIVEAKLLIKQQAFSALPFRESVRIWEVLQQLMKDHPVLLNRAPTLHRLGVQAFQPRLVTGKAILLHPLVCPAFNADFDGDQMAVHLPLSLKAQAEAWKVMWSRNNLLSPATGHPILTPSQDMVLGCYYLTAFKPKGLKESTPLPPATQTGVSVDKKCFGKESGLSFSKETLSFGKDNETKVFVLGSKQTLSLETTDEKNTLVATHKKHPTSLKEFPKEKGIDLRPRLENPSHTSKSPCFNSFDDASKAYYQHQIKVHQPVWVRTKALFESGAGVEDPLEIRVTLFGQHTAAFPTSQYHYDKMGLVADQHVLTTPGRILLNHVVSTVCFAKPG